ncbi:MAG: cation-transporting P-type ATPase [Coriobacteriia bacterium]|nr:cation-transporting P-type ATPase [Coriobacteriia bacterium]
MESPEETMAGPSDLCGVAPDAVYGLLQSSRKGLSAEEASKRLETYGENVLTAKRPIPMWRRFSAHLLNMFAILLWVAAALSFASDQAALGWAVILVILLNAVFAFVQEYRAEKAIEALKNMLPPKAKVIRGGQMQEIDARVLVPGDVLVVEEGDLISADARLVYSADLRVDNSALTGEVDPVVRRADVLIADPPSITDVESYIFTGSTAVLGQGRAVVYATGMTTEFGKIAGLTQSVAERLSPLQRNIARLSQLISLIAVILGIFFFVIGKMIVGMTWLAAAVFAIGIIVANVPEGLLPTLTMALSVAAQRMAKRNVLVKKLSSVETLGSTTVICTDKTGTLTANQMTVREVWLPGTTVEVDGVGYAPEGSFTTDGAAVTGESKQRLDDCLAAAVLCNNARLRAPEEEGGLWTILGDPTEAAMLVAAAKAGFDIEELEETHPRRFEHPFDSTRKRMTVVCDVGNKLVAYVKGAPKETIGLCTQVRDASGIRPITGADVAAALEANDRLASQALRVIAVAERPVQSGEDGAEMSVMEQGLTLLGLEAMQDPPRPEVTAAVAECHTAGIRVIMITGDYGLTAEAIARKIGIITSPDARIVTGADLETMDDDALKQALSGQVCFARVVPEHKMRIAQTLQSMNEVVAMTGDGVNDAPALKAADIGIAMGKAGTDVAREAADMILTDDNFASIVNAVEEGRAIFDNIRRFLTYFQTSNVAEMVPFLAMVFLRIPLPLTLLQILTIDLATDQVPALALGLENPEPGVMERPPKRPGEPILTWGMVIKAYLFLGPLAAAVGMFGFFYAYMLYGWHFGDWAGMAALGQMPIGASPATGIYMFATTMALTGIVMAQVGNGFAMRTHRQSIFKVGFFTNKMLLWGIVAELVFQAIIVYVPPVQAIFSTAAMSGMQWLVLAAFAPLLLVADEIRKYFLRMSAKKPDAKVEKAPEPASDLI